jgi:hypothetical protein
MTPIPAKVLTVAKQSSQFRVLVQIELDKYLGSFRSLRFGERKRSPAPVTTASLTSFTTEIPALKRGSRSRSGRRLTCRWSKLEPLRPEDALIKVVAAKISDPTTNKLGEPNKKVLAFTAFADTAPVTSMDRCWSGPQKSAASTWCSFAAAATSAPRSAKTPLTISSRTFLRGRTKHRSKIPTMPQTAEIDILIATDCISEG